MHVTGTPKSWREAMTNLAIGGGIAGIAALGMVLFSPMSEEGEQEEDGGRPETSARGESSTGAGGAEARYLPQLLQGFWQCYDEHDERGAVDGVMTLFVDSTGNVAEARYEGDAAEPVKGCLVSKLGSRALEDYELDQASVAVYRYSGTYQPGTMMLSEDARLTRATELEPEMRQELEDVLGAGGL